MQRKFHGFPYISSSLTTVPSVPTDSYFPALRTHEQVCPTTLQFLSLTDSSDTTSDIPYVDIGPGNGTIFCLDGAWHRFGFNEPNKSLHYCPFRHQLVEHGLKSHQKRYGGMLERSFRTLEMVLMSVFVQLYLPLHRLIHALF